MMSALITPSRSLIVPGRCRRCGGLLRRPLRTRHPRRRSMFWPGGICALNMAAGDPLATPAGDPITDDQGNPYVSNGDGDDCCCQEAPVCLFCPPGSTPHSVFVSTTTPIELNTEGCSFPLPLFPLKIFSSELSGEWELTNSEANPCRWVYVENYPFSSLSAESYDPEFSFQCFGPIRTDLQFWIVLQTGSFGGQWAIEFYITAPPFGTAWAHDLYHSGNFAWGCGTDVEDLSNTYTTFAGDRPGRNGAVSLLMDVGI